MDNTCAFLESAPPQAALDFLLKRWSANHRFFKRHHPKLAALFDRPTREYELSLSAAGINLCHKATGQMVYPVSQGRSMLIQTARVLAQKPLESPHYQTIATQSALTAQDSTQHPITAPAINTLLEALEPAHYHPGQLFMDSGLSLPPLVVYGLLSGLGLQLLLEEGFTPSGVLIIEPNCDFFLLSAYFIDYGALSRWGLELSIGETISQAQAAGFFAQSLISRSFVRLEQQNYEDGALQAAKQSVHAAAQSVLRGWGSAEDELIGVKNSQINRAAAHPMLATAQRVDMPICVVGSGPSLDALLPHLRTHHEKLILFSAGTALKPLRQAGITPDFQIEIERLDHVASVLRAAPLDKIPLIAADLVHPSTLEAAQACYLFSRDYAAAAHLDGAHAPLLEANPLVGNAALALALCFSDEIYLAGLDVGFLPGGRRHATKSFYDDRDDEGHGGFEVAGNFGGVFHSSGLLNKSRLALERAIASAPHAQVFNLSDGAAIRGASPLSAQAFAPSGGDRAEALMQIRTAFAPPKPPPKSAHNPKESLQAYQKALFKRLGHTPPENYHQLRDRIDTIHRQSVALMARYPLAATLMRGTVWHLLATWHKGAIQSSSANQKPLFVAFKKALEGVFGAVSRALDGAPKATPRETPPPQKRSSQS